MPSEKWKMGPPGARLAGLGQYRGFELIPHVNNSGYQVRKDGRVVTSQPSLEFAKRWIDKYWDTQ